MSTQKNVMQRCFSPSVCPALFLPYLCSNSLASKASSFTLIQPPKPSSSHKVLAKLAERYSCIALWDVTGKWSDKKLSFSIRSWLLSVLSESTEVLFSPIVTCVTFIHLLLHIILAITSSPLWHQSTMQLLTSQRSLENTSLNNPQNH